MLRLASDADVHGDIIRGLLRRALTIDLLRTQDFLPDRATNAEVMDWAFIENRVLITNDRNTLVGFTLLRAVTDQRFAGLIVTTNRQSVGAAIDDILLIAECMSEQEVITQVAVYLPL